MAQDPLRVLWIEPHFPGRLGAAADWLVRRRGFRCSFYCHSAAPRERWPASVGQGLDVASFPVGGVARESAVDWRRVVERSLCYAFGCYEVLKPTAQQPVDLIVGRAAGLGATLFAPAAYPGTPVVNFFDYFAHAHAHDLADEAGPETPPAYFQWRRSSRAIELLDLENGDGAWTPTDWQRGLFPVEYQGDFHVLHDGVDTQLFQPRSRRPRTIAGRAMPESMRLVSFVARSADRVRGYDRFLDLAAVLIRDRPDVLCVAAGDTGARRVQDLTFPKRGDEAREPVADPDRFWRLGEIGRDAVADLLAASDLHVYPSRRFPVARSFLEAMASGCVVLASDTEPVREFVRDGVNGLLAPDAEGLDGMVRRASAVLDDPGAHRPLGDGAAESIRAHYAQDVTLPRLADWFNRLAAGRR